MAPPTGVTFNPEGGKKRRRKQQPITAEVEEDIQGIDVQSATYDYTSEDEDEEVIQRPSPSPSTSSASTVAADKKKKHKHAEGEVEEFPSTSSASTAASSKKGKRKHAEVEDEDDDDDEEEIIDMTGSSSKTTPKTKKRRRLMINDSLCFANYNQRFSRAKQHSLIRVGKNGKLEFDFGISNRDLPSLLSCILTSFNKDSELIQHLKSEPRIVRLIKESFKDLMSNLKA